MKEEIDTSDKMNVSGREILVEFLLCVLFAFICGYSWSKGYEGMVVGFFAAFIFFWKSDYNRDNP